MKEDIATVWRSRLSVALILAICAGLFIISSHVSQGVLATESLSGLPALQTHSLPALLAQWQDPTNSGDYFSQIKQVKVGYLVWWEFPVKVYIEPAIAVAENDFERKRASRWVNAVLQAVQEWSIYLPLEIVQQSEIADIAIWRRNPPIQPNRDGKPPRASSAQTRYELYIRQSASSGAILSHRFTILLSPNQTDRYIQASGRHEIGHALGIWGHSPLETDVLYFSQVRNPPLISPRDVNTLKKIYAQPTRLGWPLPAEGGRQGALERGRGGEKAGGHPASMLEHSYAEKLIL